MALNSVAKEWKRYARMIFDGLNPSVVQIAEAKKSFYAGAWMVLTALQEIAQPHVPESEAEEYLESLQSECAGLKDYVLSNAQGATDARLLQDMTEPELREHINRQVEFLYFNQTPDTIGCMLIIFQNDGITQYGATIDPETAPEALRELADRIERRETVKRS